MSEKTFRHIFLQKLSTKHYFIYNTISLETGKDTVLAKYKTLCIYTK